MIVVDTNVIAYFIIRNDRAPLADLVLQRDPTWAAPRLWRSEMRNVLALHVWRNILPIEKAIEAMIQAENIIGEHTYDVESGRVLELAEISGCTAYDCEFVYVAERLNLPLVTADKKLTATFPAIAVSMEAFVD